MTKLSDRLNSIAEEIKPNETMVDIGCDHGFLPLYLKKEGICPEVFMVDISADSLQKARENFGDVPGEFLVGDGLEPIEACQVDKIVIAGMGGVLITQILEGGIQKAKSARALILQPRSNVMHLRKWLYNNGFGIVKEKLVEEGKFICEIIVCESKQGDDKKVFVNEIDDIFFEASDAEFKYPEYYKVNQKDSTKIDKICTKLVADEDLLKRYLQSHLDKEEYIYEKLQRANSKDQRALDDRSSKIKRLKYLLKEK